MLDTCDSVRQAAVLDRRQCLAGGSVTQVTLLDTCGSVRQAAALDRRLTL